MPDAGLIIGSNGNLYGTTTGLLDNGDDGTVFELAEGSSTVTTLATFNGSNGSVPEAATTGRQRQFLRHDHRPGRSAR